MACYLTQLTQNSKMVGYLLHCYSNNWITTSSDDSTILNNANDESVLVKGTNAPDLRASASFVSKFVSDRAIRLRALEQQKK